MTTRQSSWPPATESDWPWWPECRSSRPADAPRSLICEVLWSPAAEAAEILGGSVAAVKSLLQRARSRLAEVALSDDDLAEPTDPGARHVLDRYLAAFENSDLAEIERLLADDAILEMTRTTTWYSGKATCLPFIAAQAIGRARRLENASTNAPAVNWRLAPTGKESDQAYHPFSIVVLATTSTHITRISLFAQPELFFSFDLPAQLA